MLMLSLSLSQNKIWAGALVLWLWKETHVLKVEGLNPTTCILDGHFFHIFVVKIEMFVRKDRK